MVGQVWRAAIEVLVSPIYEAYSSENQVPPRKTLLLLNRLCNNTLDGMKTLPWVSQNPLNTLILLRISELPPPIEKKTYKTETDFE